MDNKRKKRLIFSTVIIILSILFSILYARYITSLLTGESRMHLSEVATQGAASVQRQIARDFDMLEILADGIISDPQVPLDYKIHRIQTQADKFDLFRIGIVDLDGNAITSDGHTFSVADRNFFQAAVKGNRFLSEPIIDKVDGKTPGIVYAVPVYYEGQVVSVLFSGYELEKLTKRIDISFYHKTGLAFIVDSNGNVLLHSNKDRIGKNIIEVAQIRNRGEEVAQVQRDLTNRKSGVAHFIMKEEDRFFAYAPIKGGNDWFLFTSLPATSIFERSQKVILLTGFLLAGILILLTLTVLYITTTKKKANAKIVQLAYYDQLTGAANTERFKLDAETLFHQFGVQNYTLFYFDVKRFRYLNHDLGHNAGNELLQYIVHCLSSVALKNETFAHVGSDQFLFLLYKKTNPKDIQTSVMQLRDLITAWKQPSGGCYPVQIAFGIYPMEDGDTDITSSIEKANIARKAAKIDYESNIAVYDAHMQQQIDRDTELEKAMPFALSHGEFKLFIQPKYDLLREKIVGGEALVRWIKSDGTIIMPNDFIPLFEHTGSIAPMDLHMVEQLCRFIRSQMDRNLPCVPISINQSRRYMYDPTYVDTICQKLQQSNIPTSMIELEITENLVYTDLDKLIKVLDALHQKGFFVSLDDFGSGYSSLNVLKNLQVDTIKLDRFMLSETLHSQREKAIVANIIRMAKELDMSVVAEGVETREQVLFLRSCGCETAQGYYYSKPIPAQQFEQLLGEENNHPKH